MKKLLRKIAGPELFQNMDQYEYARASICIHLCTGFVVTGILSIPALLSSGFLFESFLVIPSTGVSLYHLIYLKKHQNLDFMLKSVIGTGLFTLILLNYFLGSTMIFSVGGWYLVLILFSGFSLGKRAAVIVSVISLVALVSFRTYHLLGNPPGNELMDSKEGMSSGIFMTLFVVLFTLLIIYQYIIANDHARQTVLQQKKDLEKANHAKDDFLSIMSHEVRTPLNAVIGTSNLLADTPLNHEQQGYVKILKSASNTLLMLTNDILDFSKIEVGKLELENKPFDLSDLVRSSSAGFVQLARNKGLDFQTEIAQTVPSMVIGDPLRIAQIITNLLNNAIKFTHQGGVHLNLATNTIEAEDLELEISVLDTGIGILKDQQNAIFEAFTQAKNQDSESFQGTGLGLAIVSKLSALMGGSVEVNSTPGRGSEFIVKIKLQLSSEAPSKQHRQKSSSSKTKQTKILLAEDNEFNAIITTKILEKWGYDYVHVQNGQEAIDALKTDEFDLILMDIQMPVLNGYKAAEAIRNQKSSFDKIPIVALTADATTRTRDEVIRIGMNDLLTKPFRPEELRETIEKYVSRLPTEE